MILVCGSLADEVTEFVCSRLTDCGYRYRVLSTDHLAMYGLTVRFTSEGAAGELSGPGWEADLASISGVFARIPRTLRWTPSSAKADPLVAAALLEWRTTLVMTLDQLRCPVINRHLRDLSNYSKTFQADLISACGFLIPLSLITNDPDQARHFVNNADGDVVSKALSGEGSIVRVVDAARLRRIHLVANGPTLFQQRVSGDDVRVHVVGSDIFATRVHSEDIDYRHPAGKPPSMKPLTLPDWVAASCLALAAKLRLILLGIDLRVTSDGQWYCFEANPSPAFLFYERGDGQEISLAIAKMLQDGVEPWPNPGPVAELLAHVE